MKQKITYVAIDGTEFQSAKECKEYEAVKIADKNVARFIAKTMKWEKADTVSGLIQDNFGDLMNSSEAVRLIENLVKHRKEFSSAVQGAKKPSKVGRPPKKNEEEPVKKVARKGAKKGAGKKVKTPEPESDPKVSSDAGDKAASSPPDREEAPDAPPPSMPPPPMPPED